MIVVEPLWLVGVVRRLVGRETYCCQDITTYKVDSVSPKLTFQELHVGIGQSSASNQRIVLVSTEPL